MSSTILVGQPKTTGVALPKVQVKSRHRAMIAQAVVVYGILSVITHYATSLGGHIMAEEQRFAIKSMTPALVKSRAAENDQKADQTKAKSQELVEDWAVERGFVKSLSPIVANKSYVASR